MMLLSALMSSLLLRCEIAGKLTQNARYVPSCTGGQRHLEIPLNTELAMGHDGGIDEVR